MGFSIYWLPLLYLGHFQMCSALDSATKLVESTTKSRFLQEKIVEELEHVFEKGHSTRAAAMVHPIQL